MIRNGIYRLDDDHFDGRKQNKAKRRRDALSFMNHGCSVCGKPLTGSRKICPECAAFLRRMKKEHAGA